MALRDTNLNVSFLRGEHQNLPKTGAINGAFYLTTDTNRLYVGKEDGTLADLNKYIKTVAAVSDLDIATAEVGDFWYAETENVLVVCKLEGTTKKWQLINQNTNTTNDSASAAYTVAAKDDGAEVTYTYTVKDSAGDEVSANDSFTIVGGTNIGVSVADKTITIDGVVYGLEVSVDADLATLTLKDNAGGASSTATFKAGTNVEISKDDDNNIVIAAKDTKIASAETVLTENGGIKVVLTDSEGNDITAVESDPILYTVGDLEFKPGSTLPVYNKDEIDAKLRGLNGMSYQGTVGVGGSVGTTLPTEASSGDTYLVVGTTPVEYAAGQFASQGDLLIASGTENEDGVLTSITWNYVPSGDDAEHDTNYKFVADAVNNKISLVDTIKQDPHGSHTIAVETDGVLSVSSTGDEDGNLITTLSHNKIATITPSEETETDAKSVVAVTGITVDAYGHITGYEVTTSNLLAYELEGSNTVADHVATFETVLKDSNGDPVSTVSHALSSDSLVIAATDDGASIDLNWGSF